MVKEKTHYKKIVTWKRNKKEEQGFIFMSLLFLGIGIGWLFRAVLLSFKSNPLVVVALILTGIVFCIIDYFYNHDRNVKYEKYEVKKKC